MLYKVADIVMSVETTVSLPSFAPFVIEEGDAVMSFRHGEVSHDVSGFKQIDKFFNDAGDVTLYDAGENYVLKVLFGGPENWMVCSKDFSSSVAEVNDLVNASLVVSSMLRMVFSQRIIAFDGLSIHSSTVVKDGKGYLFLGKSGTGKSTHSRLWLKCFEDAWLLNDDNPALRFAPELRVYGTPWSGKTKCYKNSSAPVGGIVRLSQSQSNLWNQERGVRAWVTIFPSCAMITRDEVLYLQSQKTLNRIVSSVPVAHLECLPNEEAAILCYNKFNE